MVFGSEGAIVIKLRLSLVNSGEIADQESP